MDPVNITILSKKGKNLKFRIKNIDCSIINSIRRVILSEIPNVAISFDPYEVEMNDINFIKNTSTLHNEFIGHRLSMIPINLDEYIVDNFDMSDEKHYTYKINIQNTTNDIINVTTNDIKVYFENKEIDKKKRDLIFPRNAITKDHILINKLKPNYYNNTLGEEMNIEMKTRIGIAKTHARWCPVSTCTYFNTLDESNNKEILAELLKNEKSKAEIDTIKNQFNCIDKYKNFVKNEYDEAISFDVEIESECYLSPKYLLEKSIDILISKLDDIISKPNKYTVDAIDVDTSLYMVTINNETHTIANLLQACLYKIYHREGTGIIYVGYNVPHPLDERVVFKIRLDSNFNSVDELLIDAIPKIKSILSVVANEIKIIL
jgi:DNA-directed RNA polymerase subunit L